MFPKPHNRNNGKRNSYSSSHYIPSVCFCEFTQNCCGHSANILSLSYCYVFKLHSPCWTLRCPVSVNLQHISQKGTLGNSAECQPLYTPQAPHLLLYCCDKRCCICTLDNMRKIIACYSSESLNGSGCTAATWKSWTYSVCRWDHNDGLVTSAIYFVFCGMLLCVVQIGSIPQWFLMCPYYSASSQTVQLQGWN